MPQVEFPGDWESRYRAELKKNPGSIGIIAEGDSWFAFPKPLRTNLIEELQEINGPDAAIWSLARNGDTAQEIMFGQQYQTLRRLFSDPTLMIDAFMFSAGGNDFVGENLPNFLNTYAEGMGWMDCINLSYLDYRFGDLDHAYQRLADLRDAYKPQTYIFTHDYDYAVPSGKRVRVLLCTVGGWLQDQFLTKGIKDYEMQKNIIRHLLDRFAGVMKRFAERNQNVVYVHTQGTLSTSDWKDELHPTSAGFRKIAAKFQNALRSVFSHLPKP
jgi:hypothetical protein